jgi:hypothetical protein
MAKTNYTFEKRQKELAKQKKQAEKLLKKSAPKGEQPQDDQLPPPADATSSPE